MNVIILQVLITNYRQRKIRKTFNELQYFFTAILRVFVRLSMRHCYLVARTSSNLN